ncbi:ABC transporter permease [Microcoleus sp. FACHB-SPT15]|jgi:putative ABC transport system permease protein|uniref:ABC transporter permease n=1 Tax=Microcoleus sp. FACHB-SPT15 TaxID=2692830 RepID=UPI0017809917|nr:ABC transporter permease [Microcoleus sp. FACHB-SPT15]MBD1807834.1 ABC transporter permease [Microcoleus sp. FACHB-SPT15]
MVSIARKNLLEDIPRFLVAQLGIMFAVTLVTLQTGIFNGFTESTGQLINNSAADIWVASDSWVQIELTLPIPLSNVIEARNVAGVERAEALIFGGALWRKSSNEIMRVRVVGFDPKGGLFTPINVIQGSASELNTPYTVIVDKTSLKSLNIKGIGATVQVNSLPARVVGLTQGNNSIVSNAFMFTSLESANAFSTSGQTSSVSCQLPSGSTELKCTNTYLNTPQTGTQSTPPTAPNKLVASDLITYVLVQAKPGQDLQVLKQRLEAALPNTRAFTSTEFNKKNQTFWERRTGIGFILGLGAVVGVIVGVIIVGQILYSSVSDHLKQFGTLKAIGASDWVVYGVIIEQALWMAVLGYLPSMALCYSVAAWTFFSQGILILITPVSAIAVFGLTVAMCVGSAIFAIQKVTRLDPAMVFKA